MSDETHTQWGIEETRDNLWIGPLRVDGRKVSDVVVNLPHGPDYKEEFNGRQKRHAHLLAAAPELLEVLKEVIAALRKDAPGTPLNNHKYDALGVKAYAAISKAEPSSTPLHGEQG